MVMRFRPRSSRRADDDNNKNKTIPAALCLTASPTKVRARKDYKSGERAHFRRAPPVRARGFRPKCAGQQKFYYHYFHYQIIGERADGLLRRAGRQHIDARRATAGPRERAGRVCRRARAYRRAPRAQCVARAPVTRPARENNCFRHVRAQFAYSSASRLGTRPSGRSRGGGRARARGPGAFLRHVDVSSRRRPRARRPPTRAPKEHQIRSGKPMEGARAPASQTGAQSKRTRANHAPAQPAYARQQCNWIGPPGHRLAVGRPPANGPRIAFGAAQR